MIYIIRERKNVCVYVARRSVTSLRTFCEMKSPVFWDIMRYSPLKVNRRLGEIYRLHLQGRISRARYQPESRFQSEISFTLVYCWTYSALNVDAIYSSETSVDFQPTRRHYIPKDSTLHNHRCENLKSYVL
jgi:hypothetical protein